MRILSFGHFTFIRNLNEMQVYSNNTKIKIAIVLIPSLLP